MIRVWVYAECVSGLAGQVHVGEVDEDADDYRLYSFVDEQEIIDKTRQLYKLAGNGNYAFRYKVMYNICKHLGINWEEPDGPAVYTLVRDGKHPELWRLNEWESINSVGDNKCVDKAVGTLITSAWEWHRVSADSPLATRVAGAKVAEWILVDAADPSGEWQVWLAVVDR